MLFKFLNIAQKLEISVFFTIKKKEQHGINNYMLINQHQMNEELIKKINKKDCSAKTKNNMAQSYLPPILIQPSKSSMVEVLACTILCE